MMLKHKILRRTETSLLFSDREINVHCRGTVCNNFMRKMFFRQKHVPSIFLIFTVKITVGVSIKGISDTRGPNDRLFILTNMKSTDRSSDGIFERFIRNLLELLTTIFPERKLPKYCRILYHHIDMLDYKYARRLAKHVKYLSRMYPVDLKGELLSYKSKLEKRRSHRTAFLEALNTAFTLREHMLFDDYVYELKNYGTEDKLYIVEETGKLINNVIMDSIKRLSSTERKELQRKLRYAIREFNEN